MILLINNKNGLGKNLNETPIIKTNLNKGMLYFCKNNFKKYSK